MGTTLSEIDQRVKVEGKDSNNQFAAQRQKFIQDTCIEISCAQNFYWLRELLTLTVPNPNTAWFKISDDMHRVEYVSAVNPGGSVPSQQQYFTYISEQNLAYEWYQVTQNFFGRYRLKWDEATSEFQMALINPPVAGSQLNVLIKKYYTVPDRFPPFMEETIVKGSVARFCAMLEGSDLEYATEMMDEYRLLAKQHEAHGNNDMVHRPRVAKTQKMIDENRNLNQYWSNTI